MCFSAPKVPKAPPPPPIPLPPNPTEATIKAEDDVRRRGLAAGASRASTVATSPLGDASYGSNVSGTRLTGIA